MTFEPPAPAGFLVQNMRETVAIQPIIERQNVNLPEGSISLQDSTQREKVVLFDRPYSVDEILSVFEDTMDSAYERYQMPLAQIRAILPTRDESVLFERMQEVQNHLPQDRVAVIGKIPFVLDGEEYGIYYCQAESRLRHSYNRGSEKSHEEEVSYGVNKRSRRLQTLPEGFSLHVIEFINGEARSILRNGEILPISSTALSEQLAALDRKTFAYSHDPSQQNPEKVRDIIESNPTVVLFDGHGNVVSAGYLEQDSRFTFGNIALVEPTYFTNKNYAGKGFSSHVRRATQDLIRNSHLVNSYGGNPILVFNESIRNSSFHISLENGCLLAGDGVTISGNLGDAYTYIGEANPTTGLMPMGLTYYRDPRLSIQDQNWLG